MADGQNTSRNTAGDESADFIPGTIHLVDLEGTMRTKHASGSQKDVVLVPAPSADPDDPLNWTPGRKYVLAACMCAYTLTVGISSSSIYSVLVPISMATGLTLNDLNYGTGYMFLFFGLGCLVWQPLAIRFGKRPIYLTSLLLTVAFNCWAPHATKSNGQWVASRIILGFVGAPLESLCEISITDVFFTHERGFYIALYGLCLSSSTYLAPLVSGFINDGQGWQWVLYWTAIFNAMSFVFLFFFMEETNYNRETVIDSETEKIGGGADALSAHPDKSDGSTGNPKDEDETDVQQYHGTKTYLEKLKPFSSKAMNKRSSIRGMVTRPVIFLTFPVIFWSGFSYGSYLIWFTLLNGTISLIFSGPPYNFKSSYVGLAYIVPLFGGLLAAVYSGVFGNKFVLKMARKNKGVMEPEHRLWLLAISLLAVPPGLILYGVGAANGVHWFGLMFGLGMVSFGNTVGLQVSISYAIDSYRHLSSESMVTVMVIRNCIGFAIGYAVTPWATNLGYKNAFIVAACASIVQVSLFVIPLFFGKGWRKSSVSRYWRYLNEMSAAGVAH